METTVNRLHLMHRRARDSHEAAKGDAERAKTKFFAAVEVYNKALLYQGECQFAEQAARIAILAEARRIENLDKP